MSLYSYRRRIERLEALKARAFAQKVVGGRLSLYTIPLPEGTPVPEGARVVVDFYAEHVRPCDPGDWLCGYSQERITTTPGDEGWIVCLTADPEVSADPEAEAAGDAPES